MYFKREKPLLNLGAVMATMILCWTVTYFFLRLLVYLFWGK